MKNRMLKYKKMIVLGMCLFAMVFFVSAQDDIVIVPELDEGEIEHVNSWINIIGSEGGNVWKNYRLAVKDLSLSERWAAGILTWDDIPLFLTLVIGFLSQLGLVVGVVFIMYAGYKYMISVFNGGNTPSSTIKNAIIGVIIVIFSYAIMKILTSLVGLS